MPCDTTLLTLPITDDFLGCDGKPWSDALLMFHKHKAVKEENYEFAAKCRDELSRRSAIKLTGQHAHLIHW